MPVFNAERHIRRAVESLIAQDFQDFELVIADNASTDNTPSICADYAKRDSRVIVVCRDKNYGQLANFDFAASLARGKYFMWAADDDYWEPGFVRTLVSELNNHREAGLAMCATRRVHEDGKTLDHVRFVDNDDPGRMSTLALLIALATGFTNKKRYHLYLYAMYRNELVQRASPYADLPVPHPDRVFMCQFALGTRFRYVDKVLYVRTVHDQPSEGRLPDEEFNRKINADRLAYSKTVLALPTFLLNSGVVPWRRKLLIPLAFLAMGWSYRGMLVQGSLPAPLRLFFSIGSKTARLFR